MVLNQFAWHYLAHRSDVTILSVCSVVWCGVRCDSDSELGGQQNISSVPFYSILIPLFRAVVPSGCSTAPLPNIGLKNPAVHSFAQRDGDRNPVWSKQG